MINIEYGGPYINKIDKNYETYIQNSFFFLHLTFSYVLKSYTVLKGESQAEIKDEENPSRHGGGIVI